MHFQVSNKLKNILFSFVSRHNTLSVLRFPVTAQTLVFVEIKETGSLMEPV